MQSKDDALNPRVLGVSVSNGELATDVKPSTRLPPEKLLELIIII